MDRLPKIGERVRYAGCSIVGPCSGTVKRLYPNLIPAPGQDEDDEDCKYIHAPFTPDGWRVSVEVDQPLPTPWAYVGSTTFAPAVSEIESTQEAA